MKTMWVTFYDFPTAPILIIGALGIVLAIVVFFFAFQNFFNSPLNKEFAQKKKALIKEQKDLKKIRKNRARLKNSWIW